MKSGKQRPVYWTTFKEIQDQWNSLSSNPQAQNRLTRAPINKQDDSLSVTFLSHGKKTSDKQKDQE